MAKQPEANEVAHLVYPPKPGFVCNGEGWPAADHEEPSKRLAARKIKSGFYRDRFLKEVAEDNREGKANANAKADIKRAFAILEADNAASSAQETATRVRREHGRTK